MKFGIKRAALLAIATVGTLVGMGAPADAGHGASSVTVVGSGTISPGIFSTPMQQSWNFTSVTIVTVGTVVPTGVSTCGASGTSAGTREDTLTGGGTGTWGCTGGVLAGCSGSLVFVRIGNVVQVAISGSTGACAGATGSLTCNFTPTTVNPTTSYQLACEGEIHHLK